ncbi:MAG: methyltransferase domain-containing protein [Woeseiaceae bacterium]|nr:methyltransferase domain-containing protein [Woeseiaceae bacterium]
MQETTAIRRTDVRRRFDRAADTFDDVDFVHTVTREALLARLTPVTIEARTIVDLGCATGTACRLLARRFRRAHIIGVDLSHAMLQHCRRRRLWFTKASFVQADAFALPFADASIDVVFSNLLLPWIDDVNALAAEVSRVLRPDGLFAFSALGPDSLLVLRRAWAAVDDTPHVNAFPDMHNVGDALVHGGLRDPVLDVDRLTVTYDEPDKLFHDLTAVGGRNALADRRRSLSVPASLQTVRDALAPREGASNIVVELELVYGHCWGGSGPPSRGDVRIDATRIPVRRR